MIDVEKIVREYIDKTAHMSLATVRGGRPWVCEVHFAYDKNLNLYFVSKETTRHAQEITQNSYVAGNIVCQHELNELPHGIYFEGEAEAISASPEDVARYCQRLGRSEAEYTEMLGPKEPRKMYKIIVSNWAVFGKFDQDSLAKHELVWKA